MKAVLLGASRGMGRALARLLAARGERLFLLEHVAEDLERSARDLEIRGAQPPVRTAYCDLLQPDSFAPALDQAQRELDGFDTVVVTSGLYATQEELENDRQLTARLLAADFTNTVLFCEEARKRLLAQSDSPLRERKSVRRSVTVIGHAVRVQFGGGRAGPETGDPLRGGQGGPFPLPGRLGPQVPRPRAADRLRQAGFREDGDDGRARSRRPLPARRRRSPGGYCGRSTAAGRRSTSPGSGAG